jgi:iron complex outermembrane receptor protein
MRRCCAATGIGASGAPRPSPPRSSSARSSGARDCALATDDADAEPGTESSAAPPAEPAVLSPVVVTATRSPAALADVPASLSVVERADIQDARSTTSLQESLTRVPGVLVENSENFAQDERIQIRGFGTRSAFGIREIRSWSTGFPKRFPTDQTELDAIDMGAVDRVEVMRGPASALYGNASGGLVQLSHRGRSALAARRAARDGGLVRPPKVSSEGWSAGGRREHLRAFVVLRAAGLPRPQPCARSYADDEARLRVQRRLRREAVISAVGAPEAQDPGALTRAESDADPRQASAAQRSVARREKTWIRHASASSRAAK